ncbi:ABC transporter substrate-binding protein [Streptomyces sp. NPDC004629]|uniref:ABC transporter substrate-binding protein n=1 Tax=Streptomyces sp. NPDC004629 TaxID=3364705 RepID=UPI003676A1CA
MRSPTYVQRTAGGVALAISLAVVVAGCSSAPSKGGDAKLSLMIWDPAQKAGVQKAVDGFEAKYPKIKVDVQQVPQDQYFTKLDASLGAGEGPDVMWQSSLVSQYANGGALEPLDEYIKQSGVNLADYPSSITNLYKFDGKQYGIPKDEDTWAFVYNTAVFKKLGVRDVPTNDWTWDDMVKIAKEIKAKQTSSSDVPMSYDRTFNNGVASLIHQLGGKTVEGGKGAVSSPEGIKALTMMKGLQDQGLIPKVADSADFSPASSLISGTVAMAEIPSWNLSLLSQAKVPAGTFHVVRLPSVDGKWLTDTNGLSYVMNAHSAHKDAAWKLIEYLTSTKGAELQAEGGAAVPANNDKATLAAFVSANSKLVGLSEALASAQKQTYLRTSTQYPATRAPIPQIESTAMGPFYAGSLSASDAAKKIDQILDKALR